MRFYGREEELRMLRGQTQLAIKHRTARMAAVTGRRRVGKTSLIEEAFGAANMQAATGGVARYVDFFASQDAMQKEALLSFHPTEAGSWRKGTW